MVKQVFLIVTLLFLFAITITSCSDTEKVITDKSEINSVKAKINNRDNPPLLIINGEKYSAHPQKWKRIKTKYIESMTVAKKKVAVKKYGSQAQNGALIFKVENEEKAFKDLKQRPELMYKRKKTLHKIHVIGNGKMQPPKLIGGKNQLQKQINYPKEASQKNIHGKITVEFVVSKKGTVTKPKVIKGIGYGCDKEALRVIKNAKYKPAYLIKNGNHLKVRNSLSLQF